MHPFYMNVANSCLCWNCCSCLNVFCSWLTQLSEIALIKETMQCLFLYYFCRIMEIIIYDVKGVLKWEMCSLFCCTTSFIEVDGTQKLCSWIRSFVKSKTHRALIQTTLYLFNCGKDNFLRAYEFITPFVDSEPSEHILSMLVFNTRENDQAKQNLKNFQPIKWKPTACAWLCSKFRKPVMSCSWLGSLCLNYRFFNSFIQKKFRADWEVAVFYSALLS